VLPYVDTCAVRTVDKIARTGAAALSPEAACTIRVILRAVCLTWHVRACHVLAAGVALVPRC